VFNLPSGYTVNSVQAQITDNQWITDPVLGQCLFEVSQCQQDLADADAAIDILNTQVTDLQHQTTQLQTELAAAQQTIDDLAQQNTQLQQQVDTLTQANHDLQNELAQHTALTDEVGSAIETVDTLLADQTLSNPARNAVGNAAWLLHSARINLVKENLSLALWRIQQALGRLAFAEQHGVATAFLQASLATAVATRVARWYLL
jgi:TolA-binding protein